jgi:cold shock CspA family protein
MQGLSSGVPVAFNSTARGKGDSAWFAHYDDVVQATLDAGQKLSFKLEKKTIGMDQSALNYIDDRVSKAKFPLNYHR